MSAGTEAPRRIAELCYEAVGDLHLAQRLLDDVKAKIVDPWLSRQIMLVEDHIHNALAKLGD